MTWSPQQEQALNDVRRWLEQPPGSRPQVFRLEGYAGTGKTTIAREVLEFVGGSALCAAFTGKAASVMADKGLIPSSTIHRLIYDPIHNQEELKQKLLALKEELATLEKVAEPDRGTLQRAEAVRRQLRETEAHARQPRFILKEISDVSSARLVIIDEHSMVNEEMGRDLLSFGVPVLAIGDPGQLPPVKGTGFFSQGRPDVLLTEVHRQAADSAIIHLATLARQGKPLPLGKYDGADVVRYVNAERATAADQILCGTNAKRRAINARHRQLGGHDGSPMPLAGERLCCLANDRDLGLMNGTLWTVTEDAIWEPGDDTVYLRIRPDSGGDDMGVPAEAAIFLDEDQRPVFCRNQQFTYGYCLTVHKSQGSQWDDIVLFNDWPSRQSYNEWLYTGITRAAKNLTIVQG